MFKSNPFIRVRRDTAENWSLNNIVLKVGEPGLETDTNKLKFGNGTTPWNSLPYLAGSGGSGSSPVESVAGKTGVVTLSKGDVGLNNVDNTSDINKPISTDTQTALNGKSPTVHSHAISDVSGLQTALDNKANKNEIYNSAVPWTDNHTLADGTRYLVGDLVYVNGKIYKAKFDNESLPVTNTTYWEDLGLGYRLNIDGRDIANIPYPVTSVNGLTGAVTINTSSANTGDITFNGVKIIGSGTASGDGNEYSTMELVPDNDLYNNDQYLIIDPTGPNHIHLRAGGTQDNSNAELIVGGENSNVKIGAGTNPEITIQAAGDYAVEFLGQIDNGFGDEPGATLHVTSIINGTITDGMTIYGEGLPVEGWVLQFGTVMAPQGSGGTGNYYLQGANYLTGSQSFNNGNSSNNTWTFGTDGNLSIPGNILLSNGTSVAVGTYDNSTGGSGGVSLNCAVGYELNWQGGRLKSTYNNGATTAPIFVDSPLSSSPVVSELLSYSNTINTDAKTGDMFDITLNENSTLANPTNPINGKTLRWRITQDGTGNRTVTLGNKFNLPSSATSPLPWSTSANKMDMLAATYHAGRDKWDIVSFVPGY